MSKNVFLALLSLTFVSVSVYVILRAQVQPNRTKIFIITPTYARPTQMPELVRLCNTFRLIRDIHWIIVEDAEYTSNEVAEFIARCQIPITQLHAKSPKTRRIRGSNQRNEAIRWVRKVTKSREMKGVVYFADDDNTYDPRIFEEMRTTVRGSTWPVGLVGGLTREGCVTDKKDPSTIIGFEASYKPNRAFPIDMAAFAVNLELFHRYSAAAFDYTYVGMQEGRILSQLGFKNAFELEPKASGCTEVR
ncbi:unnamed protein product [Dibothriocephalus latus]|uniref:Galactosylgalactosylxylosylprotein 3-beta-glucuronosyltransferase n=1 Tax=Dibothriocephalus latus TaxID=60516 RepID=A0A3P7LHY7_DIBLA|nr:unnamed protein product [Dibothriocephalus latus]